MLDADHLGEDAELYALGSLGDGDRARVERHVLACDDCAKRVGDAEATVLRLIESDAAQPQVPREPELRFAARFPSRWILAVAAAFVLGLLPWGITALRSTGGPTPGGEQVVAAMLAGHFTHVPFVARVPGAPAAKVIYAREGGWIYVIAGAGTDALEIAVLRGGRSTTVGGLAPSDGVRSRFIALPGRVDAVVLLERGAAIASARTIYPAQRAALPAR